MRLPRERTAVALILAAGVALRLWQYLAQTSLWVDEIALAENVIHTPFSALLGQPLALDQVAPPGFLALVKGCVEAFGPGELSLRLVPLLGGLAGLALFAALSRRVLAGWTALLATAIFALSPMLVAFSAELKQYSSDVAATILLTLVALGLTDAAPSRARLFAAAAIGLVAVFFSHPAVLTVAGLGLALTWISLRRGGWTGLRPLLPVLVVWAAGAGAATALGYRTLTPATRDYMQRFWEPGLPRPGVIALVLLGSVVLWVKRAGIAPLLIGPVAVALAAAAAHRYPFSGRSILFLMPVAILAIADAVELIAAGLARVGVHRPVTAGILAAGLAVATALHLPVYEHEEARTVLAALAAKRQPGDAVYVFYGAERAVRFYGPRFAIQPSDATFGGCHRGQAREYLRELDSFRGRPRVWVVFAHAARSLEEQSTIRGYLDRIGKRSDRIEETGASADLFDLSDRSLLAAADSETFALPAGNPSLVARMGCGHGPLAPTPPQWQ